MFRFLIAALLVFAVMSTASAKDYRDPQGRFVVTVPQGWETHTPDDPKLIALIMAGMLPDGGMKGFCLVGVSDTPQTKSNSQADVNSLLEGQITPEFWKDLIQSPGDKNLTIHSSGSREKDGRKIYYAVYSNETVTDGKTGSFKGKDEIHAIPGSLHFVLCLTELANFELASADFEIIFNSYEPKDGELIAQQKTPSVLTMFANVSYDGVARVLSQDTPDLAASGWATDAGSLVVDGTEPWEVCEGVNFTGKCRTVETSLAATGLQKFSVGSSRRLSGSGNIAGTIRTAIRQALRQAKAERLRRR